MSTNIKATNIELTDAIKDYVNKNLLGLDRFITDPKEDLIIQVEVGKTTRHHKSGDYFRAEFNVDISGKKFYVSAKKDNLYGAIDEAKEALFRKIDYSKNKERTLLRRGAKSIKKMIRGLSHRNPETSK
ncbi:MAG TPA: ribosome-associated translation inhibitor RaiA [Candidatus Paceibacterota bacterium]|jgi:ribosomal subunit interface protein|nr:ribosome-associated translation inhibitor RaiA [Candidatus Paceibacterota bacterium]HOX91100.1 ribosome-associated translation inhibitor RaiA [Candidatus Paceibacterota bacterium]HPC12424.1 ribosome-associated translation inhibitor RaiA [Candidatus Paceibacterota bacterium]HPI66726.1 ribosome-associated translation inhibitor RaiA [Candidatus Paceibacterota bacterium]HQO70983.1 ribosome-associated translation inhibitor RaiA [Candidatus Paceibacterota bacterium]